MKIEVTQQDISEGTPGVCMECPIALAVQRATGDKDASVTPQIVWVGGTFYVLPVTAREFIRKFDGRKDVAPFEFEMEPEPGQ